MKKILSVMLSIVIFFSFTLIIYLSVFKYFEQHKVIDKYLSEISLVDKANTKLDQSNYFIDNVNNTYDDLKNMSLSIKEIKEIEQNSNINNIIKNILIDKIDYVLKNKSLNTKYNKIILDKELTINIKNKEIQNYIKENDYKIIEFERTLNKKIKILKQDYLSKIDLILNKSFLTITIITFIICSLLLIIINKEKSIKILCEVILISNSFIILELITLRILFTIIFKNSIINYYFKDFFIGYTNCTTIISILLIFILIVIFLFIQINENKNKRKIKPRIRKVEKNEEDFNF